MNTEGSAEASPSPVPENSQEQEDGTAAPPEESEGTGEENGEGQGTNPEKSTGRSFFRGFLKLLLAVGILTGAFFGRYALLRAIKRRRLENPDRKQVAVALYRQAERVSRYGGEIPPVMRETAEKARFSQHDISGEELQSCMDALRELTQAVHDALPAYRRFLFRFWTGNQ